MKIPIVTGSLECHNNTFLICISPHPHGKPSEVHWTFKIGKKTLCFQTLTLKHCQTKFLSLICLDIKAGVLGMWS